jgi:hypothetical protein
MHNIDPLYCTSDVSVHVMCLLLEYMKVINMRVCTNFSKQVNFLLILRKY